MMTQIKTPLEIEAMRQSGKILSATLKMLERETREGITTKQLDKLAEEMIRDHGATPSFLGYQGFPASLCVSINEEIVHGIPSQRVVKPGDLVGLDLGATYKSMITDSAVTVPIGQISDQAKKLLKATKRALMASIDVVKNGIRTGDIGSVIEGIIHQAGFCVVESLCGHGVGHQVHEDPSILNYGTRGTGQTLKSGMTFAIEPCISVASTEMVLADDGWTCLSADGSLSAQFEHTILITDQGAEILTV